MEPSKKWQLNRKDLKDIAIMAGAAALSYVVTQVVPFVDFGQYQWLVTLALPVLTYAVKKAQQGEN